MKPHYFSETVLTLYRAAQAHTPLQFPSLMLEFIHAGVEFDTALFGLVSGGSTDHSTPHYVHLKNENIHDFLEWISLKKHAYLLKQICTQPNRTHFYSTATDRGVLQLRDVAARSQHRHVIAIAHNYGSRGIQAGVALRRANKGWHFTTQESRRLEALVPHATEAFRINQALFGKNLMAQATEAYRGSCVYDDSGIIHFQCDGFTQLAGTLFEDFEHFKVPQKMMHGFIHNRLKERHFLFDRKKADHLNFVQVRTLNPLDSLSDQELRVAKFYGTGLSYKELADELGIAPPTARRHIEAIYAKLKIRSKADLAFLIHAHSGIKDMQTLLQYLEVA